MLTENGFIVKTPENKFIVKITEKNECCLTDIWNSHFFVNLNWLRLKVSRNLKD